MKYLFATLLFITTLSFSYGQASNVAHETITVAGIEQLKLDLGTKDIEIKSTKGSRLIVESRVTISLPNETLLKYLIDSGRYGLETSVDPATGTMTLSRKRNTNILIVRGEECEERFSYVIFVPEAIKFTEEISASASNK
jgi:hypothetical protein